MTPSQYTIIIIYLNILIMGIEDLFGSLFGQKSPIDRLQEVGRETFLSEWIQNVIDNDEEEPEFNVRVMMLAMLDTAENSEISWTSRVDEIHHTVDKSVEALCDWLKKKNLRVNDNVKRFARVYYLYEYQPGIYSKDQAAQACLGYYAEAQECSYDELSTHFNRTEIGRAHV